MANIARWIELISKQKYSCSYTFQLDGIGLLRQLQFEEFLYRKVAPVAERCLFFIVNNHSRTGSKAVVLGLAGKPQHFVKDVEETKARGISLIRRFTGGGTVIVDECSVNTSVIASTRFADKLSPTYICGWSFENVFRNSGIFNDRFVLIEGDFVVKNSNKLTPDERSRSHDNAQGDLEYHKVAGNSQAYNAKAFVHHTVFPWDISPLISEVLLHPEKAPDYRKGRKHTDFLRSIREALDPKQCINTINDFENSLCKGIESISSNKLDRHVHVTVSLDSAGADDITNSLQSDSLSLSGDFIEQAISILDSPSTMEY
ncbi:uncharacterized protein BXIN_2129 [Babesia sp. Xinjiang]|uniref:uncharacterized protein n=1 Tax=Babesia sp. Xinjiang TaxID=462227 RepID=UPI000A220F0F|nr:uncharacterized protein BXIN_2129 [Babesia sp. Xinjiang]ORM40556.1 hypothetical protein BXIN_2129 [Babesia sp. Xinjiang]